MGTFLIGFQFMQGLAAITRHGVTKYQKHTGKLFRKTLQENQHRCKEILHIASGRSLMYGWKSVLELPC